VIILAENLKWLLFLSLKSAFQKREVKNPGPSKIPQCREGPGFPFGPGKALKSLCNSISQWSDGLTENPPNKTIILVILINRNSQMCPRSEREFCQVVFK